MSYAQSKKELIYRVDSLNSVVDSWKTIYSTEKSENLRLKNDISNLQTTITNLNSQVSNLTKELNLKKSEAQNQYQELSKIKEQLKVKSDSLNLVKNELDKLKPPPVKVNSAPPVANQQVGPYKTVRIGTQVWMTKNLDLATFRNGDPIPEAKTVEEWKKAGENKQPAWCYYNNDSTNRVNCGKLYNWYAVNDPRGLAPEGYHIPSEKEWETLEDFVDGAEEKLKSKSGWGFEDERILCSNCKNWNSEYSRKNSCHKCKDEKIIGWKKVSESGNNSTGFNCNLCGNREPSIGDHFGYENYKWVLGDESRFWSSTEDPFEYHNYKTEVNELTQAICFDVDYMLVIYKNNKGSGFSVRCVRD
jgi:uncharacterized protein (TIGR02145 family)